MKNFFLKHIPNEGLVLEIPQNTNMSNLEPGFALARPEFVTICASDLYHIRHSHKHYFPGHEWVGKITNVGDLKDQALIGSYVTSPSSIGCGQCEACCSGHENFCNKALWLGDSSSALSSSLYLPVSACIPLPSTIEPAVGPLVEVSSIAAEAISHLVCFDNVVILGGGAIGIFLYHFLEKLGASPTIVEENVSRLRLLQSQFNIKALAYGELLINHKLHSSFSSVLDATGDLAGRGAAQIAPNLASLNSKIVIIGKYKQDPKLSFTHLNQKGTTIVWLRGAGSASLKKAISLWDNKTSILASKIIKQTYPITAFKEAFESAFNIDTGFKVSINLQTGPH